MNLNVKADRTMSKRVSELATALLTAEHLS